MKNLFISIAALSLFVAVTLFASPLGTFTARNNYQGYVGTITLNTGTGPVYMNVPGPGEFNIQVSSPVHNVIVNHYIVPQGITTTAKLENGATVRVSWEGTNYIIINPVENN